MLLYVIFTLAVGIEAGVNEPLIGFKDLNGGTVFNFHLERNSGFTSLGVGFQGAFYQGRNEAYTLSTYGLRFRALKSGWLFAPVLEAGGDYVQRQLNPARETGISFNYSLGVQVNFTYQLMTIYPIIYYEGITDLRTQAGFIGVRLGIKHEL
jgi:hypothetical protein